MAAKKPTNSLERFRKTSARLVLEEHDHCEVPAGCGGVVLRWLNPHAVQPFLLHIYSPASDWTIFLDALPQEQSRIDLAPGRHVLAIALEQVELSGTVLACVLEYHPREAGTRRTGDEGRHPRSICSAGDGSWKVAGNEPGDDLWTGLDFDDAAWPALVEVNTPALDRGENGYYRLARCQRLGGACLGLPPQSVSKPARGRVWIRKVFTLPPEA